MSQFLSNLNLESLRCQQHDQIANFVCLDTQCEQRGITCAICEGIYHNQHQVKPLKYFLHELIPKITETNLTIISAQIDLIVNSLRQKFNKINEARDREQLVKTFNSFMTQLHDKINNQFEVEKGLRQLCEDNSSLSMAKINSFISRYQLHEYQLEGQTDKRKKKLSNQEKFLYQILDMLKEKVEDYQSLIKSKADIKEILGLFILTQSKERVTYTFSQQLKHSSIKIIEKFTAKQEHNYSSNFVLIEPMLYGKKKTLDKKTVKIKLDKLNSWVNIGICIKSKVVASNYYFNTEETGHGAYTISNDGYSWHNIESSTNSHYHGFSFNQGETVIMTFDPKAKKIKYSKENSDKQHEMDCEPIPGEQMYFCCTLNTHDETVSIVQ